MLIENTKGNYSFVKGISPYSAGAVAAAGFEIEHVQLSRPVALRAGFDLVTEQLRSLGRPRNALCGMELRIPRPLTFQGFAEFNAGYIEVLKSWDVFINGVNPVARTNVAPQALPPSEPVLYGFSYTTPRPHSSKRWPISFLVAGAGELPEGSLDAGDVVRRGDTSPKAIEEKARFVMGLMAARLKELGADWSGVTVADVYTVHDFHLLMPELLAPKFARGLTWHYARPPITTIEYEMDMRGCRREIVLYA